MLIGAAARIANQNAGEINGKKAAAAKKIGKGKQHQTAGSNEQRIQSFCQNNAPQ